MTTSTSPGRLSPTIGHALASALLIGLCHVADAAEPAAPSPAASPETSTNAPAGQPPATFARRRSSETFALVGIGAFGKQSVALFDSSDASFKKVLHQGDLIAGLKLLNISTNHVELQTETGVIQLALRKQIRHEGDEWRVSDLNGSFQSPGSDRGSFPLSRSGPTDMRSGRDPRSSAPGGFNPADILRAMEAGMSRQGRGDRQPSGSDQQNGGRKGQRNRGGE